MQTALDLEGANCPFCFNETLDDLARLDGVSNVEASLGGSCIVIDHDDEVAVETLVERIRGQLHGIEMASNEIQMAAIDPSVLVKPCIHHHGHVDASTAEEGTFQVSESMTLGEIVTVKPSLAPELQRRGFDFCCHGDRTLAVAAAALDLDARIVAAELSAIRRDEPPADWSFLRPNELIDHIVSVHHRYLWDELPRIGQLVDKIVSVHGERHPELSEVQRLFVALRADFEPHLTTEEEIVFPAIRERITSAGGRPGSAVDRLPTEVHALMAEHEVVGDLLEKIREVTNGYTVPADGCATYAETYRSLGVLETDTHLHVHKENNVLFLALDDTAMTGS